eukprot:SAG11_NODE_26050_length_350_cov_1.203187_1_plen_43_part_01
MVLLSTLMKQAESRTHRNAETHFIFHEICFGNFMKSCFINVMK